MDLGAFSNIEILNKVMQENGICVPRLRGLRLMSEEEPLSNREIERQARSIGLDDCERACESNFVHDPFSFELSSRTRYLKNKYLIYDKDGGLSGINWKAIHGKKRKLFKYNMKMAKRRVCQNLTTFNKYCGQPDILYIHARIGGRNWLTYRKEVEDQPWFIEKVDDPFDSTYCDIYARIKERNE